MVRVFIAANYATGQHIHFVAFNKLLVFRLRSPTTGLKSGVLGSIVDRAQIIAKFAQTIHTVRLVLLAIMHGPEFVSHARAGSI